MKVEVLKESMRVEILVVSIDDSGVIVDTESEAIVDLHLVDAQNAIIKVFEDRDLLLLSGPVTVEGDEIEGWIVFENGIPVGLVEPLE